MIERRHLPYRMEWAQDPRTRDKSMGMLLMYVEDNLIMRTPGPTNNVSMACDLTRKSFNRSGYLVYLAGVC